MTRYSDILWSLQLRTLPLAQELYGNTLDFQNQTTSKHVLYTLRGSVAAWRQVVPPPPFVSRLVYIVDTLCIVVVGFLL